MGEFGLENSCTIEWDGYIKDLHPSGIKLDDSDDKILWTWNVAIGHLNSKLAYDYIAFSLLDLSYKWWHQHLFHWMTPLKIMCFAGSRSKIRLLMGTTL